MGPWIFLVLAILLEVGATSVLDRTEGFHQPGWSALVLGGYALSIWLLALAVRDIPVPVAYAVWSGLGTAGIVAVAAVFLGYRPDAVSLGALAMVVVGVVVLNLHAPPH